MKQLKDWENELEKKKCTNNVSKPLTNLQKDTLKSIDELTQHFRSQRILCRFCCPEHPARLSVETIVWYLFLKNVDEIGFKNKFMYIGLGTF